MLMSDRSQIQMKLVLFLVNGYIFLSLASSQLYCSRCRLMLSHAQQLSTVFSLNLVANALKPEFGLKLVNLAAVVGCMLVATSSTHQCQRKQS